MVSIFLPVEVSWVLFCTNSTSFPHSPIMNTPLFNKSLRKLIKCACSLFLSYHTLHILCYVPNVSCKYEFRVPTHPWKSVKVLEFFILNSRPWKYLKTGQVLESPWISFHRYLKVLEFTRSNCTIPATLFKQVILPKTRFANNCHVLFLSTKTVP